MLIFFLISDLVAMATPVPVPRPRAAPRKLKPPVPKPRILKNDFPELKINGT